jgi:site-specific DNA recombinase
MKIEETVPDKLRAAIYARVSSPKQREGKTIESQIQEMVDFAKKNNLEIPEGWMFEDCIPGDFFERPGLDGLRDLIESGGPDVILFYCQDRLARSHTHQTLLLEEFKKCGVNVIFLNRKKPAETPEEHLLEQFLGVIAEYEKTQIAERCRRGRLHKARAGSVTVISSAPYGYRYIRDTVTGLARYELHQEEAETVLKLFQMYGNEGHSMHALQTYLSENGKKTRSNSLKWDRKTLRNMLRNRAYTGLAGFGKTKKCINTSKKIIRSKQGKMQVSSSTRKKTREEDWITIQVPAIISEDLYHTVQKKIDSAHHFASRNTKVPSLLQGLLVCEKCRASYYKKSRTNKHTYYCCHNGIKKTTTRCDNRSVRQDELDNHVWEWVMAMLSNPQLIEVEIQRRLTEDPESKSRAEREMNLLRDQKKLVTSRDKLLDAYTETNCMTLEEFKKRMDFFNQKTTQVERELAVINVQKTSGKQLQEQLLTIKRFTESLNGSSEALSIEEKQLVVRALIDEIVIGEESIKIRHCIPINDDVKLKHQKCPLRRCRSKCCQPRMKRRPLGRSAMRGIMPPRIPLRQQRKTISR